MRAADQAVGLDQLADQTPAVGFVGGHGAPVSIQSAATLVPTILGR